MTDKEILANLKMCWEYLNDIDNNGNSEHCNGQLRQEQMKYIHSAMNDIARVYDTFRSTLDDEEVQVDRKNGTYYIGNSVCEDYTEQEDEEGYTYFPTCADIDYYWYEDYEFLDK